MATFLGFKGLAFLLTLSIWLGGALNNQITCQINESDTSAFQFNATLTGIYQKGNVNFLSLRGKVILSLWLGENLVFKSQNGSLYQEIKFTLKNSTE